MELDVGDVIVMASDGLFDNVYDGATAALVQQRLQVRASSSSAAAAAARAGRRARSCYGRRGPFPVEDSAF